MKRHPALRELSSDHHQGLVQARRLVKASEAGNDLLQVAGDFLTFWAVETSRHFREEEEALLPAFARYGDPAEPPIVRMLLEHVQIRRLVSDLRAELAANDPSPDTMRSIGEMLRAHIRYEEDVVFPLIERVMPEAALNELPARLADYARIQT